MKRSASFAILAAAGVVVQAADSTAFAQVIGPPPVADIAQSPLDDPLLDDDPLLNDDSLLNDVESELEDPIDDPLESDPIGEIDEPLDGSDIGEALEASDIGDALEGSDIGEPLQDSPIGELLGEIADGAIAPIDDTLPDVVQEPVDETTTALPNAVQPVVDTAIGPVRPFVEGMDPFGHAIEQDVLLVLIEPQALAKLERSGWPVQQTRALPSLGLVLARVQGPPALSLARATGDLRASFPEAAVDYNFLYRLAGSENDTPAAPDDARSTAEGAYLRPAPGLRLGLIDSAVSAEHSALSDVRVVSRDFTPHEGERPLGHGTAVASILAASAGGDAEILAASVFFQGPGYAPGATTESLLGALDWLAGSKVDVINMSLAGPPDTLLERALARVAADGPTVVAAVGNNGPAGEPLYPAAYDSVVGVTAVDRERRIFAYANRGEHVAFAAPGVNVKVANSIGGLRLESGTSMASPYVAAIIARALRESGLRKGALIDSLKANAVDLGDEGFDRVFGYGLVQPPREESAAASLTE